MIPTSLPGLLSFEECDDIERICELLRFEWLEFRDDDDSLRSVLTLTHIFFLPLDWLVDCDCLVFAFNDLSCCLTYSVARFNDSRLASRSSSELLSILASCFLIAIFCFYSFFLSFYNASLLCLRKFLRLSSLATEIGDESLLSVLI